MLRATLTAAVAALAVAGAACTGPNPSNVSPSPSASGSSGGPSGAPSGGPSGSTGAMKPPAVPAKGAYLGAAAKPSKYTPEGRIAAIKKFQQLTGRQVDVVHTYHSMFDDFPDAADKYVLDQNQLLLLGWAANDSPGIAAGKHDALIRQRAEALKALRKPIFLAFRWEMDRPNLRTEINGPKNYIAAWKHARKIFQQVGATNVAWVWGPASRGMTGGYAQAYYPGDDQVDWIGTSAYTGRQLRPFSTVVKSFMAFSAKHPKKPVMICEFGLADRGGIRPGWLDAARAYIKAHKQIKAVLYFNGNQKAYANARLELNDSTSGKKAWNQWAADPYFNTEKRTVGQPR